MNISEIVTAINSGEVDSDLDVLLDTARSRQSRAAAAKAQELVRGDIIRVTGNIRPKYLIGAEATVEQVLIGDGAGRVEATMNIEVGKYRIGHHVGFPAVCVTKVG